MVYKPALMESLRCTYILQIIRYGSGMIHMDTDIMHSILTKKRSHFTLTLKTPTITFIPGTG